MGKLKNLSAPSTNVKSGALWPGGNACRVEAHVGTLTGPLRVHGGVAAQPVGYSGQDLVTGRFRYRICECPVCAKRETTSLPPKAQSRRGGRNGSTLPLARP